MYSLVLFLHVLGAISIFLALTVGRWMAARSARARSDRELIERRWNGRRNWRRSFRCGASVSRRTWPWPRSSSHPPPLPGRPASRSTSAEAESWYRRGASASSAFHGTGRGEGGQVTEGRTRKVTAACGDLPGQRGRRDRCDRDPRRCARPLAVAHPSARLADRTHLHRCPFWRRDHPARPERTAGRRGRVLGPAGPAAAHRARRPEAGPCA